METGHIERALGTAVGSTTELDGGMIGTVHRVSLADGRTVVTKTGETPLTIEAQMLGHLDTHGLPVPEVIHASDELLVLEYIDGTAQITPDVARDGAAYLAALHETTANGFGFSIDTLTGTVIQPNPWTEEWIPFYADNRLRHVRDLCLDAGVLGPSLARRLTGTIDRLDDILIEPDEPALIHGDVWETNLLTDGDQVVAFLDPACYYAHPEIELAYIDWTETFGESFFERYDALRGIEDGFFETRRYAYRLYPLLVHLRLFGEPYDEAVGETLDQLSG
ncbi:fructosamine kinase family protein [Halovenus rubra]|uniref:Fructosamine kinase family protein n=2 Tax=Halovenus rubra TaxID=869890 RepID=A0ACC7E0K1_9EURY|nr:fructosamine kinase family protein [Halovenus rubra]